MKNALALSAAAVALLITSVASASVVYDGGSPDGAIGDEATVFLEAENFTLSTAASINDAHIYIGGAGGIGSWEGVANYFFFSNNSASPGTLLASGAGIGLTTTDTGKSWAGGGDIFEVSFKFPSFAAAAGTEYFFGIHLATDYSNNDGIFWTSTDSNASNFGRASLGGTMDNWISDENSHAFQLTSSAIPEPSTWALMTLGFAGLGFAGWRSRRRSVAVAA